MKVRLVMESNEIIPDPVDVLMGQGLPADAVPAVRVKELMSRALEMLSLFAAPRGIIRSISRSEFERIYRDSGNSEGATPLEGIYPQAEQLAVYVVTLGDLITQTVESLFRNNEYPLGAMLDFAASAAIEKAADIMESKWRGEQCAGGGNYASLRYSPGYCGWNIEGQRPLLKFIDSAAIGVQLGENCLMLPLKTTSGLVVGGEPEIHVFDNDYGFCERCNTLECRTRIAELPKT
ncbi:MAG: hypothetical protein GY835_18950 [bacterium]|nr:hypothetical protein [bacterium]